MAAADQLLGDRGDLADVLEALRCEVGAVVVAAKSDVVRAHHVEGGLDVVDDLGQVAVGDVDQPQHAAVLGNRFQHLPVARQFEARPGQDASAEPRVGIAVGEHGGRRVGEDDGTVDPVEDLPEAALADVHQVDDDAEFDHSVDQRLAGGRQPALVVGGPAAVGVDVAARVGQARHPQAQLVVEVEEARFGAERFAALEGKDERHATVLLGLADLGHRGDEHQVVEAFDLVVQVPGHLEPAVERVVELLVVEVHRAELGGDAAFLPSRQVVLAHAAEPDGVRRHAELGEGADVESERRLPVRRVGEFDPLVELHLAVADGNQDVAVTVDHDRFTVQGGCPL